MQKVYRRETFNVQFKATEAKHPHGIEKQPGIHYARV
jgi:hypothetical protein